MIPLQQILPEWAFWTLRAVFLVSTLAGHLYAAWNYFRARRVYQWAIRQPDVDPLERVHTRGQMMDFFRNATVQAFLLISAIYASVLTAVSGGASERGAVVLIPLVPASLLLTFTSFRQSRRQRELERIAEQEMRDEHYRQGLRGPVALSEEYGSPEPAGSDLPGVAPTTPGVGSPDHE